MSAGPSTESATSQSTYRARPHAVGRLRNFWQRVSEGRQIEDLWSQFAADARASYGFYQHDVDWEALQALPRWKRPLHVAKEFFWALVMKLTPARRILLIAGLVLIMFSATTLRIGGQVFLDIKMEGFAVLIFLVLLALELSDKVTMKRDLEIAREIQTWLVPSEPPIVPNGEIAFATRPQNSVAGDYYDAFYPEPNNPRFMLVMADVAGKSVPAALLMATLQASLRTIAGEGAKLDDLVLRLNRYACAHSLDGRRFTTAVIAEYDPLTRRIAYVNAGHNAPILRRRNGDTCSLDIGGLPLGIEPGAIYQTGVEELHPGDSLILFTDGVVEAFNEAGEEFGNGRWLAVIRALPEISAQQSLQFLMQRVDQFVGATRQSDDITCLVFRSQ